MSSLHGYSWLVPVAAGGCGGGGVEELADLRPGEFLVAGLVDSLAKDELQLHADAGERVDGDVSVD